ncbi:MAG: WD40/YVTN/BNR-like repeat-containing protein [Vicinamibacterales bacterium]
MTGRLRGISAVSERVVWASGAGGTVIRTEDGGTSWKALRVPDAETLDFRDVDAVDERTAYVLSIGHGDASRIYKTTDAGATWVLQFRNEDSKAFFDAMVFSDRRTGFALSDAVDGQLVLSRTTDGARWSRVLAKDLPPALAGEGAYAASGTNLAIQGDSIWFGTTASRVIRSTDRGVTWTAASTPLPSGTSAGIFSIAFRDRLHGIVVGGDYKKENEAIDNAAVSADGGATWALVKGLGGFRSAVAFIPSSNVVVAVGPSGSDYSTDGARTWQPIDGPGFHTLSVAPGSRHAWAGGENGTVARIEF